MFQNGLIVLFISIKNTKKLKQHGLERDNGKEQKDYVGKSRKTKTRN